MQRSKMRYVSKLLKNLLCRLRKNIRFFAERLSRRFFLFIEYYYQNISVYFFGTITAYLIVGAIITYELFLQRIITTSTVFSWNIFGSENLVSLVNSDGSIKELLFVITIFASLVLFTLLIKLIIAALLRVVSQKRQNDILIRLVIKRCFTDLFALCIAIISLYLCLSGANERYLLSNTLIGKHEDLEVYIYSEPREKTNHTNVILAIDPETITKDKYSNSRLNTSGDILISAVIPKYPVVMLGQKCFLNGELKSPENYSDFDYEKMLGTKQIYLTAYLENIRCVNESNGSLIRNKIYMFKKVIISQIEKKFTEPTASLLVGFIFGENRAFNNQLSDAFTNTGTSHIIAASGYNVNILLLGINSILAAVDKKIRSRVSIIIIWVYCILAGLSASIIRATIMASVAIIGSNIGKNRITLNALLITVCIMMIINPFEIYNVGFLLSVGSTLALIVVLPSIEKTIINFRASNILSDYKYSQNTIILQDAKRILGDISTNGTQTIACTLVVLPILIVTFKQVSISTVIANILILPLVELALLICLIWILINSLIPSLAIFITFIPTLICNLIASILKIVGDIEPVIINNANSILPLLIIVYTMILFVFVLIFYPTVYEKNMGIG